MPPKMTYIIQCVSLVSKLTQLTSIVKELLSPFKEDFLILFLIIGI